MRVVICESGKVSLGRYDVNEHYERDRGHVIEVTTFDVVSMKRFQRMIVECGLIARDESSRQRPTERTLLVSRSKVADILQSA